MGFVDSELTVSEHQECSLLWVPTLQALVYVLFKGELGPEQTVPVPSLGNLLTVRHTQWGPPSCQHEQLQKQEKHMKPSSTLKLFSHIKHKVHALYPQG